MSRLASAALTLTILIAVAPVHAADRDANVGLNEAATNVVRAEPPAPMTVWSVPPIEFGQPERGALLPGLYVSLASLNAIDAYTTSRGIALGAAESNPMMRAVAGSPAGVWAVKGGVTAGSIVIAERLWHRNHKPQAIALMLISNGMMAVVTARNARVLRQQR